MTINVILDQITGDEITKQAVTRTVSRWLQYSSRWYVAAGSYHGRTVVLTWSDPGSGVYCDSGLGC